jgi:hypothetical protein
MAATPRCHKPVHPHRTTAMTTLLRTTFLAAFLLAGDLATPAHASVRQALCEAVPTPGCVMEMARDLALKDTENSPALFVETALKHGLLDIAISLSPRLKPGSDWGALSRLVRALILADRRPEAEVLIVLSGHDDGAFDEPIATALVERGEIAEAERIIDQFKRPADALKRVFVLASGHATAGRLAEALALAEGVEDPSEREAALYLVAETLFRHGHDEAGRSVLPRLNLTPYDLYLMEAIRSKEDAEAIDLAGIADSSHRDSVAATVAEILAKSGDGPGALKAATLIGYPWIRVTSLSKVAGYTGSPQAFAAFDKAAKAVGGITDRTVTRLFVEAYIRSGQAKPATLLVSRAGGDQQQDLIATLAMLMAERGHVREALQITRDVKSDFLKSYALQGIADVMPVR